MPGFNSKISYDPTNHLTLINLEQSDCVTRRTADRQHLIREDARSRLRGVTAAISAELNGRASKSARRLQRDNGEKRFKSTWLRNSWALMDTLGIRR